MAAKSVVNDWIQRHLDAITLAEVQDDELESLQPGTEGEGLADGVAVPGDGVAGAV